MPGKLIVCATPLGNLGDVSDRLRNALREADVVFAEDTRRSRTLTDAMGITVDMRSYFAGNERTRDEELDHLLAAGNTVALITDAGTPVVSDPGAGAVEAARRAGAVVTLIPGPSAVTGAVAVSGMTGDRFVFDGFLPRKGPDRASRLEELVGERRTIVLFVAPHRLLDDLRDLSETLGADRPVCIVRELTKMHEEIVRLTLAEAVEAYRDRQVRGELVVIVEGAGEPDTREEDDLAAKALAEALLDQGVAPSGVAKELRDRLAMNRNEAYDLVQRLASTPEGSR